MRIDIVTLFPDMFTGPLGMSMIARAKARGVLDIHFTNPRDFAFDKHRQVDDSPFGGGSGMVLKIEPMTRALRALRNNVTIPHARTVLLCPSGQTFSQQKAKELATYDWLTLICGHYEGFDARIADTLADEAISIGDFVLTGGELPAMVIIDAVARMLPNVLGSEESAVTDSFFAGLLGYPQYTRPRVYEGQEVPEVLLSGDHEKIRQWRREASLRLTKERRPDLLAKAPLTDADKKYLASLEAEDEKQ